MTVDEAEGWIVWQLQCKSCSARYRVLHSNAVPSAATSALKAPSKQFPSSLLKLVNRFKEPRSGAVGKVKNVRIQAAAAVYLARVIKSNDVKVSINITSGCR